VRNTVHEQLKMITKDKMHGLMFLKSNSPLHLVPQEEYRESVDMLILGLKVLKIGLTLDC